MTNISVPLDLSDVEIFNTNFSENGKITVHVKSTATETCCQRCGKVITKIHGLNKLIILRHLSILGYMLYIAYQTVRFQCDYCDGRPTTTHKPSWYNTTGKCTVIYAKFILELLVNSTVQDVAAKENLSYSNVMEILKKFVPDEIDWSKINILKNIGIDEISLKKGHKHFVVIVSTKINGKPVVLGILKDRKKETVKKFLSSIPNHLAKTVENVCCDMYDGFINAAKEVFGSKVNIVVDRFHVAKNYRKAIDSLRKKEMKRLKSSLPDEEYNKLKNIMWILRKSPNDLIDKEQEALALLFELSPILKTAYGFQNKLTKIFDQPISQKQAKRKIKQWIICVENSGITCFSVFIKTLNKLWDEILGYFVNRYNSGFVEGLNNKIKVLKRRCYGIFDTENLFRRISLDLAGYKPSV